MDVPSAIEFQAELHIVGRPTPGIVDLISRFGILGYNMASILIISRNLFKNILGWMLIADLSFKHFMAVLPLPHKKKTLFHIFHIEGVEISTFSK